MTRGFASVFVGEFGGVSLQSLGGLFRRPRTPPARCERRVRGRKGLHAEPAGHRGVLHCLHLDCVRCHAALELGDHQPTVDTEP
jgi:hypothetical protein